MASASPRINGIDPPYPAPLKSGMRFAVSRKMLGRMERLARAGAEIETLSGRRVPAAWTHTPETEQVLVQSVLASGEIEGETIVWEDTILPAADRLTVDIAAVTRAREGAQRQPVLQKRLQAVEAITTAAIWALTEARDTPLSFDFVLELHRRMFETTLPDLAGKLKTRQNFVKGGAYQVQMLPPAKTEPFLRELCDRTRRELDASAHYAETSAFLTIAEFLCDFLAIHPFPDGNGRCARVLSTVLLERVGYHFSRLYPLDSVILETRGAFYRALFDAQTQWYKQNEDLTPWVAYYTDAVFTQWTRAEQRLRDQVAGT